MVTPVQVKVAVAAVTDKPQLSETQHQSCSIFACIVIHFGVPGPVATGDSETMFNIASPKVPVDTSTLSCSTAVFTTGHGTQGKTSCSLGAHPGLH